MTKRFSGKRVLVLGLGRSGRAALRQLERLGARVTGYDRDPDRAVADSEPGHAVQWISSPEPPDFDDFDLVVTSPGVPVEPHPALWPEIDLASRLLEAPIVGVTGTNGKSTTCVLIGEMLEAAGLEVQVGGNLGTPLCDLVEADHSRDRGIDWIVAELSSFQLEYAREFHAQVAVLLNLAPDHLDRHSSLEAYAAAKARLARLQHAEDTLVFSADDSWASSVSGEAHSELFPFTTSGRPGGFENAAFVEDHQLVVIRDDRDFCRISLDLLSLASRSPIENALAAAAAAARCGASAGAIQRVLQEFGGLPHRNQLVCVRDGVRFVNDSKATNPAAAVSSLRAQATPVVWIAGGRNKGLRFEALTQGVDRVRAAVLFGESAADLERALLQDTELEILRCKSLAEAVPAAASLAHTGDSVLLSPACASFDQFQSYEERGETFSMLARGLADGSSDASPPAGEEPC